MCKRDKLAIWRRGGWSCAVGGWKKISSQSHNANHPLLVTHTHTFFLMYKTKLSRDDIIELFILQDGMRVTVAQLPTSYVVHINCQNHLRTMIQKMADPTLSVGGKDDVDCAISELKAKISSFVANSNRDDSCIVVIDCPPDIKNDTLEELQSMLTGRVIFNYCSWILIRPVST